MPPITHAKVSAKADSPDASLVRPSDWNADHVFSLLPDPVWIPASNAWVAVQNFPTLGSVTDGDDEGMPAWLYDDTATESVGTSFLATRTGDITITIYYSMAGANVTKSVRLRLSYLPIADGEDAGANEAGRVEETRAVPDNADELDIFELSTTIAVVEDDLVRLTLIRTPGHGDDDAVGDLQLHGIKVEY